MPYLRGVFINFGEETYYLSCGIVNGGSLDTETYTINNPELYIRSFLVGIMSVYF